ncbi:hypothetical protein EV363DRAFT_1400845 [Boletus edulis]|nr:hypothetical protein EV363DRAFT_1400845 [Boletus edulis]
MRVAHPDPPRRQLPPVFHPPGTEEDEYEADEFSAISSESEPFYGPGDRLYRNYHKQLNGCPPAQNDKDSNNWAPFENRTQFETAELLYTQGPDHNDSPPFVNWRDLYQTIDKSPYGDVNWQRFKVQYTGEKPPIAPPPWMEQTFEVWHRDVREVVHSMLANPGFRDEIDLRPFREFATDGDVRQYQDFMSGNWVWDQADIISEDPTTHGSTFVPIILGSDKTTVSVGTGNNEFYPLYLSIGNVRNNVRRAHRDALVLIGFLAIPKTTKEHASDPAFRKFRRQLFHSSLSTILDPLKHAMSTPEVVKFGDGYFRRVIYGLGPYIADYEEQALLSCIVRGWCARCRATRNDLDADALTRSRAFTEALCAENISLDIMWDEYGIVGDLVPFTNDFPRADIYRLIAPDILHQLIKGCFKDHLVDWVETYLKAVYGTKGAQRRLDDIDRRIAAVAPFAGLRRFPQGRGFKQWTGDDSKALMKGHVPQDIVRTFRAFLEFCYMARRYIISENTLVEMQEALDRFHHYREVFRSGDYTVVNTFSLPRQHAAKHYPELIRLFGAPNGLCSSITECKHIKAVKQPYRRSSKYKALGQILLTNQRLDKLAACRVEFEARGMLQGTCLSSALKCVGLLVPAALPENEGEVDNGDANPKYDNDEFDTDDLPTDLSHQVQLATTPQQNRARTVMGLAEEIGVPVSDLLRRFLHQQLYPNDNQDQPQISVFNSASVRFYAPSDISGLGGMRTEYVRSAPNWQNEGSRRDCVFILDDVEPRKISMHVLSIACVFAFFSFKFRGALYQCAVIWWFDKIDDGPDEDTGMWMVQPSYLPNHSPRYAIVDIKSIYRAAHLIPIYGKHFIRTDLTPHDSYDAFRAFYVNKYGDHHAFEIASGS